MMKVNEIFYSLQGEGFHTGRAAVFVRFSGCNLQCPFCDTSHEDGVDMTSGEIIEQVVKYPTDFVVLTGGEPCLQIDESFVDELHKSGKYVAVETNGTVPPPGNADWISCSPKQGFVGDDGKPALQSTDELKVVFDGVHELSDYGISAEHYYIQPCDTGIAEKNNEITKECINFIKHNPKWKLSLQTQKILNVR